MEIPVLIEPLSDNGFRATTGEPFAMSAEGRTKEEARCNLQELIKSRLANEGVSLDSLELPPPNPWIRGRGMFRDNPLFDVWQEAIPNIADR